MKPHTNTTQPAPYRHTVPSGDDGVLVVAFLIVIVAIVGIAHGIRELIQ